MIVKIEFYNTIKYICICELCSFQYLKYLLQILFSIKDDFIIKVFFRKYDFFFYFF